MLDVQEKLKIKEEKDAKEAKYKFALVDDRQEQVGLVQLLHAAMALARQPALGWQPTASTGNQSWQS